MKKYKDKNWLYRKYWNKKLTIIKIAKLCKCYYVTIYEWLLRHDIPIRSSRFKKGFTPWNKGLKGIHLSPKSEFKKGMKPINFKGKTMNRGYVSLFRPNHSNCDSHGYVLRSHLVAEKALGRYLKKDEMVHHVNEDKEDDRNCNLLICKKDYHNFLHGRMRRRNENVIHAS